MLIYQLTWSLRSFYINNADAFPVPIFHNAAINFNILYYGIKYPLIIVYYDYRRYFAGRYADTGFFFFSPGKN